MKRAALLLLASCSLETPATIRDVCGVVLECEGRCGPKNVACLGISQNQYQCECDEDAACVHDFCAQDASAHLVWRGD